MTETPLAEFKKRQKDPTLLDALNDLTEAKKVREVGKHKDTGEAGIWHREDLPLLDQLHVAIHNNIGGQGGGKAARERTPLDVGAFQLYETIEGRIRSWLLDFGNRPAKDERSANMLRTWHRLWIGGVRDEALDKRYQVILEGWAQQIKDKLDAPKRIEIESPCPSCGQEWKNIGLKLDDGTDDPDDVERVRVLNAVERENVHESFVMCAACDKVWRGIPELRELRIAIDDKDPFEYQITKGPLKGWLEVNEPPDDRGGWIVNKKGGNERGKERNERNELRFWKRLKDVPEEFRIAATG